MSAATKPFETLGRPDADSKGVVKWRKLRQWFRDGFAKFEITATGATLSQPTPNSLHLDCSAAGAAASGPFGVAINGGLITVQPGLVYCAQALDPTGTSGRKRWAVPLINGVALDAAEPPSLAVPEGGSGFVCLKVTFYKSGEVSNWPWSIIFSATEPGEIDIIRDTGGNHSGTLAARDGEYYILIATIKEGAVYQWVRGNICANLQWEELFTFA